MRGETRQRKTAMQAVKPIRPRHYSLRFLAVLAIGFCLQSASACSPLESPQRMRASVHAPDAGIEWDTLNREVMDLYRAGHYDRAIVVAKKALEVAEHNVGPHHPDVSKSLNNLAELYRAKGDYAAAEPLYKRALAILEQTLGPTHPNVTMSLAGLALLYVVKGDYAAAEPLYKRVLAISEQTLGPTHPDVATSLNNLAALYRAMQRDAEATLLEQRAAAIQAMRR